VALSTHHVVLVTILLIAHWHGVVVECRGGVSDDAALGDDRGDACRQAAEYRYQW